MNSATLLSSPRPLHSPKKKRDMLLRRGNSLKNLPLAQAEEDHGDQSSSSGTASTTATSCQVRFTCNAQGEVRQQVHEAQHNNLTEQDCQALWWSRHDLQEIRKECQRLVKQLQQDEHYVQAIRTLLEENSDTTKRDEKKMAHQVLQSQSHYASARGLESSFHVQGKQRQARHQRATLQAGTAYHHKASSYFCRRYSAGKSASVVTNGQPQKSNSSHSFSSYLRKQSKSHSKASKALALEMAQWDAAVAYLSSY
eukprot:CAMPEP_0168733078 /NCGR_PEP_ID=MMETSP0724-20121128/8100_1 /TAXON_ID=265536 /ORGANISM="Amphiprora sp., Strain CCMP467" /LENGTH=253 /DNA_ID=CAMNT_0008780115 /DNA_START=97 /DNA_END=858 /DNA_ORIENTATION=-